jgi:hypothetical protein
LKLNHLLDEDFLLELEKWAPSRPPRARRSSTVGVRGRQKHTTSSAQDHEAIFSLLLEAEGVCLYLDTTATLTYTNSASTLSKFAYTRRLAASLGVMTLRQDKPLYVRTLSPTGTGQAPLLSETTQIPRLLTLLKRLEAGSSSDFLWSFYQQLVRRTPRASVVVVLSDFLDPLWEEALSLLYQHAAPYSEVILLQVLHPEEQAVLQNTSGAASTNASPFHWVDLAMQKTRPIAHETLPSLPHLPPREVKAIQAFLHRLRAQNETGCPSVTLCSLTTDMVFEKYLLRALQSTR